MSPVRSVRARTLGASDYHSQYYDYIPSPEILMGQAFVFTAGEKGQQGHNAVEKRGPDILSLT